MTKSTLRSSAVLLFSILTLAACSRHESRPGIDPAAEVRAAPNVRDSLAGRAAHSDADLSADDQAQLVIKKSALEKEFLLHGSVIPQNEAATGQGLQARVVAFRQVRGSVFMLEARKGHIVTQDLPSTLILAEFPILQETDNELVIDFNMGMRQAFVAGNWFTSDYEGDTYAPRADAVPLLASYIESIRPAGNSLEIRQVAQVIAEGVLNAELRYYLTPYNPNPAFVAKETSDMQHVGYFEVAPVLEENSGRSLTRISRWNDQKTITYHVSANTPAEYVQAVKDGILYWNKAFGREVLRAEMAPAGVTAPDPQHNVIQWVPNESAGGAYADALMDPRSGEILHAQVYMTSVFPIDVKQKLPSILRKLRQDESLSGKAAGKTGGKSALGLKLKDGAWRTTRLCQLEGGDELARDLEKLAATGASEEDLLRVAQDYVREVVAHEVGHTLGLRHNFAGSLASTVTLARRDRLFLDYILLGQIPLTESFTSSVMEYSTLPDGVLGMAQRKASGTVHPYDRLAIGWGYANEIINPSTAPLFCTDSHAEKYKDCVRFDSGALPVVSNTEKLEALIRNLPISFAEKFILARTASDPRDRKELNEVVLSLMEFLKPMLGALSDQIGWFTAPGVPSISAERQFAFATDFNAEEILATEQESVREQIGELGGVDRILFAVLPAADREALPLARQADETLAAYLSRSDVRDGIGYDGKSYSLSDADIAYIRDLGKKFFAALAEKLVEKSLETLVSSGENSSPRYSKDIAGDEIESRLGAVARAIILAQSETIIPGPEGTESKVHAFRYKKSVRAKAARLLARSLGMTPDFSAHARGAIAAGLQQIVMDSLGDLEKLDPSKLSREQMQWILDQQDLLKLVMMMEGA